MLLSQGEIRLVLAQVREAVDGTNAISISICIGRFVEPGQSRVVPRRRQQLPCHQLLRVASHSLNRWRRLLILHHLLW